MYGQLEQLKYINHLGEVLNFGRDGLYVNEHDLHNFSWNVVSVNDKISGFERKMQTKDIPVRVACVSEMEGIIKRNRLFQIPEKDVLAVQYGKLIVNGYYCECFVTQSKKSRYSVTDQYMEAVLTITTDRPYWIKETKLEVKASEDWVQPTEGGVDFPFDFPFDFLPTINRSANLANNSLFETAFRMEIHGLVINPTVTVNEHEYQVNTTVQSGDVLIIDSIAQKVFIRGTAGDENVFDLRNRDSYIFQPIPTGELHVRWDNSFDVDIYLLEQLSEPKWILGGMYG